MTFIAAASAVALVACGQETSEPSPAEPTAPAAAPPSSATEQRFPDVIAAQAERALSGAVRFTVTISSPYDSAQRYADAWRVLGDNGTVYGVRELLHDHAGEQPFTRSLEGVDLPDGIELVTIEARDLVNGWGGATVDVSVPPHEP